MMTPEEREQCEEYSRWCRSADLAMRRELGERAYRHWKKAAPQAEESMSRESRPSPMFWSGE